jgi:hypothetical protein
MADAQVAVGGVKVQLESGGAASQGGERVKVVPIGAKKKAEITSRFRPVDLVFSSESLTISGGRIRVWHLQDANHAAAQSRRCAGGDTFFVSTTGFAHVNMRIDHPG